MRYHVVTLGCAKNTVDSMRLDQALRHRRHRAVADPDDAELLLVNTCGFIDAAKDESLSVIRELDEARSGGQRLFVIGCMTEIAEEEVRRAVPGVDATFGAEAWDRIASEVGPADPRYDIPDPQPLIAPGTTPVLSCRPLQRWRRTTRRGSFPSLSISAGRSPTSWRSILRAMNSYSPSDRPFRATSCAA